MSTQPCICTAVLQQLNSFGAAPAGVRSLMAVNLAPGLPLLPCPQRGTTYKHAMFDQPLQLSAHLHVGDHLVESEAFIEGGGQVHDRRQHHIDNVLQAHRIFSSYITAIPLNANSPAWQAVAAAAGRPCAGSPLAHCCRALLAPTAPHRWQPHFAPRPAGCRRRRPPRPRRWGCSWSRSSGWCSRPPDQLQSRQSELSSRRPQESMKWESAALADC